MVKTIKSDKNVYIYGSGRIAQAFIAYIYAKHENYKEWLRGCMVTTNEGRLKEIEGLPVYNASEIIKSKKDIYVYIAVRDKYFDDIETYLKEFGFYDYERVDLKEIIHELEEDWKLEAKESFAFIRNADIPSIPEEEYAMFLALQLKNSKIDFEVNLVDHCNLNCQSCNHFSPIAEERYISLEELKNDLFRMNELFQNRIGNVMLLGGEPLLHPFIGESLQIAREALPEAHIQIYTNGVLLPKMHSLFWDNCKKYNIEIMLTKYPIKFDYDSCINEAHKHGVEINSNWESTEIEKTTYKLPIRLIEGDLKRKYRNFILCDHANRCVVVRHGRIYTCPFAAFIDIFNKEFSQKLPEGECNSISIYEVKDAKEILDYLKTPVPLCSYCDVEAYQWNIPWKTSNRRMEEWVEMN